MTDKEKTFKADNPRLTRALYTCVGVQSALRALQEVKAPVNETTGYRLALAIVEAVDAEARQEMASQALRAAAREGYDIGRSKHVYSELRNGAIFVTVEPEAEQEELGL